MSVCSKAITKAQIRDKATLVCLEVDTVKKTVGQKTCVRRNPDDLVSALKLGGLSPGLSEILLPGPPPAELN